MASENINELALVETTGPGMYSKEESIMQYEIPQAEIILFVARQPLASENVTEPALVDDNLSLGNTPGFTEGIEDW